MVHPSQVYTEKSTIVVPALLSVSVGATIIFYTSPTITTISSPSSWISSIASQPILTTILAIHALVTDVTFTLLISFLILCNHESSAQWIARNRSFPYSYSPAWNFGPRSFDFQLLVFEIFHTGKVARSIHMVGMLTEEGLWAVIVYLTFGNVGLVGLCLVLGVQAVSYRDLGVGLGIVVANSVIMGGFWWVAMRVLPPMLGFNLFSILALAKTCLFWAVTTRTLSHVLEPLPPTYRPDVECFDNNFGSQGWTLCLSDLPAALWLVILGNVSEFGAGMPGRLFNAVVYKCMYKAGYRTWTGLLDVKEAKHQAWQIIEHGWIGHPQTAKMYEWALSGRTNCVQEDGLDEKVALGAV